MFTLLVNGGGVSGEKVEPVTTVGDYRYFWGDLGRFSAVFVPTEKRNFRPKHDVLLISVKCWNWKLNPEKYKLSIYSRFAETYVANFNFSDWVGISCLYRGAKQKMWIKISYFTSYSTQKSKKKKKAMIILFWPFFEVARNNWIRSRWSTFNSPHNQSFSQFEWTKVLI